MKISKWDRKPIPIRGSSLHFISISSSLNFSILLPSFSGLSDGVCARLEAIALVFLCSPYSRIRLMALEVCANSEFPVLWLESEFWFLHYKVLNAVRGAAELSIAKSTDFLENSTHFDDEIPLRVMDIIDSIAHFILVRASNELSLNKVWTHLLSVVVVISVDSFMIHFLSH